MIEIKDNEHRYWCSSCNNKKAEHSIRVGLNEEMTSLITLCEDCLKQLITESVERLSKNINLLPLML